MKRRLDATRKSAPAPAEPPRPYVHGCEHEGCTAWGGWGFGFAHVRWFCNEHKAEGEAWLAEAKRVGP